MAVVRCTMAGHVTSHTHRAMSQETRLHVNGIQPWKPTSSKPGPTHDLRHHPRVHLPPVTHIITLSVSPSKPVSRMRLYSKAKPGRIVSRPDLALRTARVALVLPPMRLRREPHAAPVCTLAVADSAAAAAEVATADSRQAFIMQDTCTFLAADLKSLFERGVRAHADAQCVYHAAETQHLVAGFHARGQ